MAAPTDGNPVDATGAPAVDPTKNVLALVEEAVKRQDNLRDQESKHQREMLALRVNYDDKLREAESKRIDAIRAVDVDAVGRAAVVSATQAATLAGQVAASAEALRAQVEQTRIQFASTLAAALEPVQRDVADLRRVQYEQQGQRAAATDANPLSPLLAEIQELKRVQYETAGARAQNRDTRDTGQSNRSFLVGIAAVGITLFGLFISAGGVAVALLVG